MKKIIFLPGFFFLCLTAFAQIGGTNGFTFLNLVSSSRVAATGGNLLAADDADVQMGIYNPSLLNKSHHQAFNLSYVNYFGDINFGFAGMGWDIDSVATFAATIHYLNYGTFEERTETGEKLGEFQAGDYVLTLSAGRAIDTNFSVGANLKLLYSSYYNINAAGVAADVAATYKREELGFVAALVFKNVGFIFNNYIDTEQGKLPFEIQLALSKKLEHAPFRFHLALENLQKWDITYVDPTIKPVIDPATGLEQLPEPAGFGDKFFSHMVFGTELITKNFILGLGYNHKRKSELRYSDRGGVAGFSFGLAMHIKKIQLGYSFASYHLAGKSNHITVGFNLKDFSR
jgi:hypothetical protein